jgi:hypothetical protein
MHIQNVALAAQVSERLTGVRRSLMAIKGREPEFRLPAGGELTQGAREAIRHIILGDLARQETELSAGLEALGLDTAADSFMNDLAAA